MWQSECRAYRYFRVRICEVYYKKKPCKQNAFLHNLHSYLPNSTILLFYILGVHFTYKSGSVLVNNSNFLKTLLWESNHRWLQFVLLIIEKTVDSRFWRLLLNWNWISILNLKCLEIFALAYYTKKFSVVGTYQQF